MNKRHFPESELIINNDGSCFHLHLKPEQLADKVVLVGDPARVNTVAAHFDTQECEVSSREFHTITGTYKGKRITCQSHGIGCDNIDIVANELDTLANMILVGKLIRESGIVDFTNVDAVLDKIVSAKRQELKAFNKKALEMGFNYEG